MASIAFRNLIDRIHRIFHITVTPVNGQGALLEAQCDAFTLTLSDPGENFMTLKIFRTTSKVYLQINAEVLVDILILENVASCRCAVAMSGRSWDSKCYDTTHVAFHPMDGMPDHIALQSCTLDMWCATMMIMTPFLDAAKATGTIESSAKTLPRQDQETRTRWMRRISKMTTK